MKKALLSLLLPALLGAQETPHPNRVAWEAIFPEPLPEAVTGLALEATSQYLRPDRRASADGKTLARLDGEEWQLTFDWSHAFGPGRFNVRLRVVDRSGGIADQAFVSWHQLFGVPQGGRELTPKYAMEYHLERNGVVVADLQHPKTQLMDTDIAYVVASGTRAHGYRYGASVQLPTGKRSDFSGSGGVDGLVGGAAWKTFEPVRVFAQVERVFVGLPESSPYRQVLGKRAFNRAWLGAAYEGQGPGFWGGLGLGVSVGYVQNPYQVYISRLDVAGWQQTWTFTHRALPHWRFGFSEEAGTYHAPDITAFVGWRM